MGLVYAMGFTLLGLRILKPIMTAPLTPPTKKPFRRTTLIAAGVLACSSLLAGCTRPGDDTINKLLVQTYTCKGMEVIEYSRTNSMPGIFSFVGQYSFQFRFKEGEAGARKFFKGLFAEMEMKGQKWEDWLKPDNVQDYIADECTEAGQMALERISDTVLEQVVKQPQTVRLPLIMPMVGWAEMMPGKNGWDITVRRDKVGGEPLWSEPIPLAELMPAKAGKKPTKAQKK